MLLARRVVVAAFRSESEASLAQSVLRADGLDAEAMPRDPSLPRLCADVFSDGFDVAVDEDRAADAIALLQTLWPDEAAAGDVIRCPECGAGDYRVIPRLWIFAACAAVLLLLGTITGERDLFLLTAAIIGSLLLFLPPARCTRCGHRWRPPRRLPMEEEVPAVRCTRCGSDETEAIDRRRQNALTLIVNLLVPPLFLFWPAKPRRRCSVCGHEWR